jgi:hypothetical protein
MRAGSIVGEIRNAIERRLDAGAMRPVARIFQQMSGTAGDDIERWESCRDGQSSGVRCAGWAFRIQFRTWNAQSF